MRFIRTVLFLFLLVFPLAGCDRIYALLHKPGGEERANLGAFQFNEYNEKVAWLQRALKSFGYNIGLADGKFGASTREAVARFQADEGLTVTRFVVKATWSVMQDHLEGPFFKNGQVNVRAVQKALSAAGFSPGAADGRMGKNTREALKSFQRSQGLSPDGYAGLKTLKALKAYADKLVEP